MTSIAFTERLTHSQRAFSWRAIAMLGAGMLIAAWVWQAARGFIDSAVKDHTPGDQSANHARAALRDQPLSSADLRDLALAIDGDLISEKSKELLYLADRVSRREIATQLLLLNISAQTGEARAAIRHYDAVLATTPALRNQLIGILANAASDPEIFEELLSYADRAWFVDLVEAAASQTGGVRVALSLAKRTKLLTSPNSRDRLAPRLIEALISAGQYAQAYGIAKSIGHPRWDDIGFSEASLDTRLGGFAWQIVQSPTVSAEWRAPTSLSILVEPGRLVPVAKRITSLTPGSYQVKLQLEAPSPPGAQTQWTIRCEDVAATPIKAIIIPAPQRLETIVEPITVPQNCPFQEWDLWAAAADAQMPSQTLLSWLSVKAQ